MPRMLLTLAIFGTLTLSAQQPTQKSMGSIDINDAKLSGGLEVSNQRAHLLSSASVTAYDHTAQVDLDRGGLVAVCATSAFHLFRSGTGDALLFALDRGAMEIHTRALPQDAILTPDLRFTMLTAGTLDLRMRVTREGDTCVENRGDTAPVLQIKEGFGDATYHLAPQQHVLFEHGSLHEVVDNERSSCGCPESTPSMVATATPNATSTASPQQAAALNPFPAAQSADLAPTKPTVPLPPLGSADAVALSYGTTSAAITPAPTPAAPALKSAQPPPTIKTATATKPAAPVAIRTTTANAGPSPETPPGAHDILRSISRFFRRIFGSRP